MHFRCKLGMSKTTLKYGFAYYYLNPWLKQIANIKEFLNLLSTGINHQILFILHLYLISYIYNFQGERTQGERVLG
jgi:hypothetical protein